MGGIRAGDKGLFIPLSPVSFPSWLKEIPPGLRKPCISIHPLSPYFCTACGEDRQAGNSLQRSFIRFSSSPREKKKQDHIFGASLRAVICRHPTFIIRREREPTLQLIGAPNLGLDTEGGHHHEPMASVELPGSHWPV